jgi:hypothetical protein
VWTTNTDAHTYSGRDPYSNCTAATSTNTDAHTYFGPYSNCTATTRTNKYSNCTAATSSNTDYALMLGINGMLKECLGGRQPKV